MWYITNHNDYQQYYRATNDGFWRWKKWYNHMTMTTILMEHHSQISAPSRTMIHTRNYHQHWTWLAEPQHNTSNNNETKTSMAKQWRWRFVIIMTTEWHPQSAINHPVNIERKKEKLANSPAKQRKSCRNLSPFITMPMYTHAHKQENKENNLFFWRQLTPNK